MVATWALLSAFHNMFLFRRVNCTLFFQAGRGVLAASSQALCSWEIPVCKQHIFQHKPGMLPAFGSAHLVAHIYSSACRAPIPHTGKETACRLSLSGVRASVRPAPLYLSVHSFKMDTKHRKW